jgi:hypothetical protein
MIIMKTVFLSITLLLSVSLSAQQNFITAGYGLNIADNDIFLERDHYIVSNNLVLKASYARSITDFIRGKVDIAYADYDVINGSLSAIEPTFREKSYQRWSLSFGPVFKILSIKNFTFLSGFNAGCHFGNDLTVSIDPYFDYAINPLSITYEYKGVTVAIDSYIGSNMYSNVYIGLGYSF